ncbi:MAG: hypothetical protein ACTILD_07885 [Pseudoalteromonas sp.]
MQRIYLSLLTLCLLLTLVGQAVASVSMVCEMPHMSHSQKNNNSENQHHTMSAGMMNIDCCDDDTIVKKECGCPASACNAHSILNIEASFLLALSASEKVQLYLPQHQHLITRSLYRPPMSA